MTDAADPNLRLLEDAAVKLGPLLDELVLVGGCAAGLLVSDPGASPIRATLDVDLIVEAATYVDYDRFGKRLTERGFAPGQEPGDPICRWRHSALIVDVMPLDERVLGFSNRWYARALRTSVRRALPSGVEIAHVDAPHFVATKLEAFRSRGRGDFVASADLEDVVIVVDGRATMEEELAVAAPDLMAHVAGGIGELLADRLFVEALPGYFWSEADSPARLELLMRRLRCLASV